MSLSDIMPNARNTINNGMGCFTRGICTQIAFPNPLFLELTYILICLGDMHLKSGIDFTSAIHEYFVLFLEILKQYTRFSAARSCPITVFSDPLIIKYPPASYLHSPVCVLSKCLYWFKTQILDFNMMGSLPM